MATPQTPTIAPASGKLGVLTVGLGAVATTLIAGVELAKRGMAEPIGSLTQMGTMRLGKRTEGRAPLIRDVVQSLDYEPDAVVAVLGDGRRLRCRRAVVAAGAYVNAFDLLPAPAAVSSIGITAHFFAVDGTLADELADMPGMLWFDDPSGGTFVYSVPPIRYPDGRLWFKIGGHSESGPLPDRAAIDHWHRTDGGDMGFASVERWVAEHLPGLAGRGSHSVGCVITESSSALPVIAEAVADDVVLAAIRPA